MTHSRSAAFSLLAAAVALLPASAQTVVSAHSGAIYYFEGAVFVGGERLEQKFGNFPDIGEGGELRTEHGRAEVLLTPGVMLRVDENSRIRMLSTRLSDTRVELLEGSAILESEQPAPDQMVRLIYKRWQVRVPRQGVYRIDSEPAQLQVYKGEVEVSTDGEPAQVTANVKAGDILPLAAVLVPEPGSSASDVFKEWAMSRSQAVFADNKMAAGIVDDQTAAAGDGSQIDLSGLGLGGFTYFPTTAYPSANIGSSYGMSLWPPYQTTFISSCLPLNYSGWPSGPCFYPTAAFVRSPIPITSPIRIPRVPVHPAPVPHIVIPAHR
jgi:FecR protein